MSQLPLLLQFIRNQKWPLLLVGITLAVAFLNWQHTWLTGWDTLHPEFDFPLHFYRSFFGVWREDQGLGTLAAHSHMSELPRIAILWLLNLFLPLNTVKFTYVLTCLVLGPLGIYYFVNSLFKKSSNSTAAAAFIGALWYLMNLGTVQHFYIVFEMFAVQFAALGWLFWLAHLFQQRGTIKIALVLFIVSFLAAPMAYASLLWWSFVVSLGLFLGMRWLQQPSRLTFLRTVGIGILFLTSNAFWLFPNIYFLLTDYSTVIQNSTINRLFSPEAFWHNQAYGDFLNVILLKNFLFNWLEFRNHSFQPLLQIWIDHLNNPLVRFTATLFSLLGLTGLAISIKEKNRGAIAMVPLFFLSAFMLTNQNPPFTQIFSFLRENSDIFKEGLRFPFTKFSLTYMLGMSVYISVFFQSIFSQLYRVSSPYTQRVFVSLLTSLSILALGYFFLPAFNGHLINQHMKNEIPAAYFELFEWSKTASPQSRMALLPLETAAGWHYLSWGYEGPGFWWFGLEQPLIVRDADRWSKYNETFYKELQYALTTQNSSAFTDILTKYQVDYLLIDHSLISPGNEKAAISLQQALGVINKTGLTQVWQSDMLSVYQFKSESEFLNAPPAYTHVITTTDYTKADIVYSQQKNYLEQSESAIIYPFAALMSDRNAPIDIKNNTLSYRFPLATSENEAYRVMLPTFTRGDTYQTPVQITYSSDGLHFDFPSTSLEIDTQTITFPQLEDFTLPLHNQYREPMIEINEQQFLLSEVQPTQTIIELAVGAPLSVRMFDLDKIRLVKNTQIINEDDTEKIEVSDSVWHSFSNLPSLTITNPQVITFRTESRSSSLNFKETPVTNCQPNSPGTSTKKTSGQSVIYETNQGASACEGGILGNSNYSYVLAVKGNNQAGRSLKLYLTHLTSDQTIFENLLPETHFDEKYTILSQKTKGQYYLSWENRSYGQVSRNELEHVLFYPFPLEQLAAIHLIPENSRQFANEHVSYSNSWKHATYLYGMRVKAEATVANQPGLVTLSQSYDDGWLAFARPANQLLLTRYQRLPHYRYNGWANAWEVPAGEWQLVIIYWPQLLSFAGYALLVSSGAYLVVQVIRSNTSTTGSKAHRLKRALIRQLRAS